MQPKTDIFRNFSSSDCQCGLFSKKNPVLWIFCISRCLVVPSNLDKWNYTVMHLALNLKQDGGRGFPKNDVCTRPCSTP